MSLKRTFKIRFSLLLNTNGLTDFQTVYVYEFVSPKRTKSVLSQKLYLLRQKKFIFAAIPRHCHNTFSVSESGVVTPKICRNYPFVETFLPIISLKSFDARIKQFNRVVLLGFGLIEIKIVITNFFRQFFLIQYLLCSRRPPWTATAGFSRTKRRGCPA